LPLFRPAAGAAGLSGKINIVKSTHHPFLSFLEIHHPEWYGLSGFRREFWGFLSLGKTGFP
jgi:hypothetical protein